MQVSKTKERGRGKNMRGDKGRFGDTEQDREWQKHGEREL